MTGAGMHADAASSAPGLLARTPSDHRRQRADRAWTLACQAAATLVVGMLAIIIGYVVIEGLRGLTVRFLTQEAYGFEDGGGLAAILGTLQLVPIATLIAAPIGVLAGVYMAESSDRRMPGILRTATETMAGLPSVVVGIFAFTLVVMPMRAYSALAGIVALAIIMIPIVARSTEEIVRLVPGSVREASLALGIPMWRTTISVVVRTAAAGILTAVMLAVARGAGETAPLILTSVGNQAVNVGDLGQPMDSLPTFIYFASGQPSEILSAQAWAASLVLLLFVLTLNVIVRWRTIGRRAA